MSGDKRLERITAVIVTYNRKHLLLRNLSAILKQTRPIDRVLIIDNASTDGTREILESEGWLSYPYIELLSLSENTGGAGGFSTGLKAATDRGMDWAWMMDDDAEPHPHALQHLLSRPLLATNIYGATAVSGAHLSWPMTPYGGSADDTLYHPEQLPPELDVQFLPFLGILISAQMVQTIGTPDAGFFLAADDVDYCMRARSSGAQLVLIRDSQIEHPASERYRLWLPGRPFYSLKLTPWKRYYDVRNRIFVARNHYGAALYYSTIPGSFLRLIATLWHENNRLKQLWAFTAGMIDGLQGKKGRRHDKWGISF